MHCETFQWSSHKIMSLHLSTSPTLLMSTHNLFNVRLTLAKKPLRVMRIDRGVKHIGGPTQQLLSESYLLVWKKIAALTPATSKYECFDQKVRLGCIPAFNCLCHFSFSFKQLSVIFQVNQGPHKFTQGSNRNRRKKKIIESEKELYKLLLSLSKWSSF